MNLNISGIKISDTALKTDLLYTKVLEQNLKPIPRATIKHKSTTSFGTFRYDVIRLSGGNNALYKKLVSTADAQGIGLRQTSKEAANAYRVPVAMNADNFEAPDTSVFSSNAIGKVAGFNIVDGKALGEWRANDGVTNEALVYYKDGSYKRAIKSEDLASGKKAQDYVDEGAVWSVNGRGFVLLDGVSTNYPAEQVSGRTILGFDANGNFVVILVEGSTNVSGINTNNIAGLCLFEGLVTALMCDGGGSSQCYWNGCYALPASATNEPPPVSSTDGGRKSSSFLLIDVPFVEEYDSGYIALPLLADFTNNPINPIASGIRQVGNKVTLVMNADIEPAVTATTMTKSFVQIPFRYISNDTRSMNGFVVGTSVIEPPVRDPVPVICADNTFILSMRLGDVSRPARSNIKYIGGEYSWFSRWF
jgi:exopolysaccharide biosynthesis protein